MSKTPLISIITVCFNSAKTIRQTIESVLNQTYTHIEYILVDGKSTDNTLAIIEEYAPQFAAKGIVIVGSLSQIMVSMTQ
jgi:glycosyltransferase involved in cell wall biosynthesis